MRLLCIADSTPGVGAGHMVRAYALAEHALAAGHQPVLATKAILPRPPASWDGAPCPIHVVPEYDALPGADIVIVDSYREAGIVADRLAPARVVAYDDFGLLLAPGVDTVVNPNVCAERFAYPGVRYRLTGSRFATIRADFRRLRRYRDSDRVRVLLLGLGGTGNGAAWPRLRGALRPLVRGGVTTVLLYGYREHPLDWYAAELGGADVRPIASHAHAWAAFQTADLAVVGLGVTALECLCTGIPTVVYSANATTQGPLLPAWRQAGLATLARDTLPLVFRDRARRADLSELGLTVIDGHGASRVIAHLTQ